jgi:lipid-binding SYLF domain-containing protein
MSPERNPVIVKTSSVLLMLTVLALFMIPGGMIRASSKEVAVIESAAEVLDALSSIPLRGIPPALMQDAQGVAVIPNVFKASFVIGGRHGRGVVLVREADGSWGNPLFVSLTGGSIGWQVGVQSTDVVLVFKTRNSLDRILKGKGKLTLGADVGVAAGPIGRQAEAGTDAQLKAEIYSYSRSRGLFAGVSLEGAAFLIDAEANELFYHLRGISPGDLSAMKGPPNPAVDKLKAQLTKLSVLTPPAAAPYPTQIITAPIPLETNPPPVVVPIPVPTAPPPPPPIVPPQQPH